MKYVYVILLTQLNGVNEAACESMSRSYASTLYMTGSINPLSTSQGAYIPIYPNNEYQILDGT